MVTLQYIGKEPIKECEYFNRIIKPGQVFNVKEPAAKELLKSKNWKDCKKKVTKDEKKRQDD